MAFDYFPASGHEQAESDDECIKNGVDCNTHDFNILRAIIVKPRACFPVRIVEKDDSDKEQRDDDNYFLKRK